MISSSLIIKSFSSIALLILPSSLKSQNKNLITSIETKKYNFCKEYDIIPPNIKNANLLVNKLTRNDLFE